MNKITALRVVDVRKWADRGSYYITTSWSLEYHEEGSTDWKEIPILVKYSGGPQNGLSQVSNEVKVEKE